MRLGHKSLLKGEVMYILSCIVGSILGGVIPIIAILLWPNKIFDFLGQGIGICIDYIQDWK